MTVFLLKNVKVVKDLTAEEKAILLDFLMSLIEIMDDMEKGIKEKPSKKTTQPKKNNQTTNLSIAQKNNKNNEKR